MGLFSKKKVETSSPIVEQKDKSKELKSRMKAKKESRKHKSCCSRTKG